MLVSIFCFSHFNSPFLPVTPCQTPESSPFPAPPGFMFRMFFIAVDLGCLAFPTRFVRIRRQPATRVKISKEALCARGYSPTRPSHRRICHLLFFSFVSDYEDCVMSALSKCGPGAVEYGKSVIEGYAGDLLHSICRKWRHGSSECLTLPKLKPHESPKYKTLLPPLVEVLKTLT